MPHVGSKNFIGRKSQLKDLHELLNQNEQVAITAIAGMGGIGKTELSVQYAKKYQKQYPGGLCWLTARDSNLGTQLISWAGIELGKDEELSQRIQRYWGEWNNGNLLIILDDVPTYDKEYFRARIDPYLPPKQPRFKLLMTSRQQPVGIRAINLEVLSEAAALELLAALENQGRVTAELAIAKELCQWLGYLPLGIELVGSYLAADGGLTIAETLEELKELKLEAESLLDPESTFTTAQLGVAAAIDLSWQELSADAQIVGAYLGLFGADALKWEWVEAVFCQRETEAEQKKAIRELRKIKIKELLKFNLLKANSETQGYQLHSLVAEFFLAKLEATETATDAKEAFCAVNISIAQTIPQTATVSDLKRVELAIPQLKKVSVELLDYVEPEALAWVFVGLARIYEAQNLFSEAEDTYQICLEISQKSFGAEHPDVATSLNNLAGLYRSQGKYEEAEPLYQQALEMLQKLLGTEHPNVATSLNNLAGLYSSQGKYEEAEPLYQQALEMLQKLLGTEHPDIATSLNNLAGLYSSQGKYEEAEPLYQQALAIAEKSLGVAHPNTMTIRNNFADMLKSRQSSDFSLLELPETKLQAMFEPEAFAQLMQLKQMLKEQE